VSAVPELPRELAKVSHPPYVIEPPDVLQIDLISATPKPPYRIRPLDVIGVAVANPLPDSPVSGAFSVGPDGRVDFGPPYGVVDVSGRTLDEARATIVGLMATKIKTPAVTVSLVQTRAGQQIRGPHLVQADGTVGLGAFGSVSVVGMTVSQARREIEARLAAYFLNPEVSLNVVGYNSKIYYVVFDYGTAGQQVSRLPIAGGETVLDGIGQMNGLPTVADPGRIFLSRPSPSGCPPQVLPVDWRAIVECGDTRTNYQVLPGDRIVVKAYTLVEKDAKLARIIAPIERLLGVTLLGSSTVNSIRTDPNRVGVSGVGFVR
jgi:polysaccharide export outer membrane protein